LNHNKLVIYIIFGFMFFIIPLNSNININKSSATHNANSELQITDEHKLHPSDIAGTDLYAEQINVFIAGNRSIIKQSLFTNDTNILSQFDSNDPAFYKCNILISVSNGITPSIFPHVLIESDIATQYIPSYNSFVGFLYYDKDVEEKDAQSRAQRALEIIRNKFLIDLIMVNTSEPNFFPFVGHYPEWDSFFYELTKNFPMDGYWKALNIERITSEDYLDNYHVSSMFMQINSLDFFTGDYNLTTDQLDFNIDSLDLSFLENLEMENLVEQFTAASENMGGFFNATISEEELEQFIKVLSSFSLKNESHYTIINIQYEGLEEGIIEIDKNQYMFNLWDAIGYKGDPLVPSEKIYIALAGAFMSEIKVNILCTEIIDVTPINFKFYDFLLEQLELILFLADIEFDIQALNDYSFELFWVNEEGFKRSFVKLINPNDPSDIINLMQLLGFQGFSFIPTGLINPINDLKITYNISRSEPNIVLKKELIEENATYGAFRRFSYNITAKNVGNITAWGVPTLIPLELNDIFSLLTLGNQELASEVQDSIWEVIKIEYPNQYTSLEDFFNFDEKPRIFFFDSFGTGVYDEFYPNILNITCLIPYNEDMDHIIEVLIEKYPQLISTLSFLGLTPAILKEMFTNKYSIWNDNNWKLEPSEIISYQISNVSIENIDSFSPFYSNNFSIEVSSKTPEIVAGTSLGGTTPYMALRADNESWDIGSGEKFLEQWIKINFLFKNDTNIDFKNYPLERVSIIMNFNVSDDLDTIRFEIFNFSTWEFEDMNPYLTSISNNSWTFSFINNNNSLDWLFYPFDKENYTVFFRFSCIDSEQFNISINDLDIEFSTRDINVNDHQAARIIYGSFTGYTQYTLKSNSFPLSSYDMASIIAYSYVSSYNSKVGELNTYTINFRNIGSSAAENVSISLTVPGIIDKLNDFTLNDNNLSYHLLKLAPYEEKSIYFSFYTPNTRVIDDVAIFYENPKVIEGGNSSRLNSLTNEIFISAPVDYNIRSPFIREVKIDYDIRSNDAPAIGDFFNLTINIINVGSIGFDIPDINISLNEQIGDLRRIDNNPLFIKDISFNESISFNITLEKKNWKGYYFPPINFIKGSESITIQILRSSSIILGLINFSIIKQVNKEQVEIGDTIKVIIIVENTGTISIKDVKVNDMISYSQSEFSLISGKLVNLIPSISPGEKLTFSYMIKAKKQVSVKLHPVSIYYYYLSKKEARSNFINIKVIISKLNQLFYVITPCIIVLVILGMYSWQNKRYRKKLYEFRRFEIPLFEFGSRDSILTTEHTLRERLNIVTKQSKKS